MFGKEERGSPYCCYYYYTYTATHMTDTPIALSPDTFPDHSMVKLDPEALLRAINALHKGDFSSRIVTQGLEVCMHAMLSFAHSFFHFIIPFFFILRGLPCSMARLRLSCMSSHGKRVGDPKLTLINLPHTIIISFINDILFISFTPLIDAINSRG